VEARIVDLESGTYVSQEELDPGDFDQRYASNLPDMSVAIAKEDDLANLERREKYSFVWLVHQDGELDQVVLPIYGRGLWSMMYAFVALDGDLQTVRGLTFYEQGETAGLGAEVSNPNWLALFEGKQVFDDAGAVRLEVVKGTVDPGAPGAEHQVDGISGATITQDGVTNLIRYWLGAGGFGPYLDRKGRGGEDDG
jgi:Na+-transporting NADH:ubiquinone oxidoreductase subunit C